MWVYFDILHFCVDSRHIGNNLKENPKKLQSIEQGECLITTFTEIFFCKSMVFIQLYSVLFLSALHLAMIK